MVFPDGPSRATRLEERLKRRRRLATVQYSLWAVMIRT